MRADGTQTELEATGMPVGLMDGAEFAVAEWQLTPGDKVVIYSDGVTEAQNAAGEFFGKKRLREALAAHAAEGCLAIHDAIQEAVAAFTEGAAQSDDITVLVLEYVGQAILPAARLLGGFSSHKRVFAHGTRRLKPAGQDRLRSQRHVGQVANRLPTCGRLSIGLPAVPVAPKKARQLLRGSQSHRGWCKM